MIADLKPYPAMKDSGVEWLGEVPSHWTRLPGRACYREKKVPNKGLTETTVLSLSYGHIVVKPPEQLHGLVPSSFETYQIVEPGDIIVRPTDLQNDWNSLRFGLSRNRGVITSAYMCLYTEEVVMRPYGHLLLHTYDLKKVFYGLGSGLRQNLDWRDFKYLPCIVPPLPEQAAIVRYLDHADRRIRRYIRAKQKLITLLEEQKQALIHQAVTGQIDVRTGQPYPAYKPSGVEWLGDVPEHWEIRTLGRIAESFRTGPFGSMLHQSDYVEDGTPVINPIHMKNGVIVEDQSCSVPEAVAERLSGYRLGLHNLVFSRRGELGRCAIVRSREVGWLCGTGSIRVRIEYKRIVPKFLIQALQVRWVGEYLSLSSVGATMDNLNTGILKGVPLLVPPIQEQRDLLERIGQRTKTIDHAIRASKEEIRLIQEYRTRLIADVVTGKLDVREAVARLPDEAEEPELRDETDGFTDGEEEPSDDLDATPEEAAV